MSTMPPLPDDDGLGPVPSPPPRVRPARQPSAAPTLPPVPVAAPTPPSILQSPLAAAFVGAMATALVMLVGLWLLLPILVPDRDPRPEDQLVAACRAYRKTQGQAFADVANRIRTGDIRTQADAVKKLQEHAKPVADALNDSIRRYTDDKGTLKDPDGAADLLGQVSKALNRR